MKVRPTLILLTWDIPDIGNWSWSMSTVAAAFVVAVVVTVGIVGSTGSTAADAGWERSYCNLSTAKLRNGVHAVINNTKSWCSAK